MKYMKGLYVTLALMMLVILVSTTIFDDKYSGISMFICLGLFLIGSTFFINAKQLKERK
ncbi:hypothetical protein ACIQ1H_12795 [Lysinibacillus sp. NPDC097279]|uniref:hypothetical protein n=1 Tax=Lysinibacillus sp. NPDC097279 TaxID=3364143 RepID=UPI0037F9E0D9